MEISVGRFNSWKMNIRSIVIKKTTRFNRIIIAPMLNGLVFDYECHSVRLVVIWEKKSWFHVVAHEVLWNYFFHKFENDFPVRIMKSKSQISRELFCPWKNDQISTSRRTFFWTKQNDCDIRNLPKSNLKFWGYVTLPKQNNFW